MNARTSLASHSYEHLPVQSLAPVKDLDRLAQPAGVEGVRLHQFQHSLLRGRFHDPETALRNCPGLRTQRARDEHGALLRRDPPDVRLQVLLPERSLSRSVGEEDGEQQRIGPGVRVDRALACAAHAPDDPAQTCGLQRLPASQSPWKCPMTRWPGAPVPAICRLDLYFPARRPGQSASTRPIQPNSQAKEGPVMRRGGSSLSNAGVERRMSGTGAAKPRKAAGLLCRSSDQALLPHPGGRGARKGRVATVAHHAVAQATRA